MTRLARLELFGLIGAGALGAGVHAAIAPEHLREWVPLGASFVAVAVLLAAVATGYLVTRLVAVPPLDPERESFDTLGICTSAVEVFGVVLAVHIALIRR